LAAGGRAIAEMSYGIKRIFNGVVLVIAVVAIIIIMNTLVISITERMAEIGTMRAIGARRGLSGGWYWPRRCFCPEFPVQSA